MSTNFKSIEERKWKKKHDERTKFYDRNVNEDNDQCYE